MSAAVLAPSQTLTNPLLPSGPDPWVISHGGYYYYTNTTARNVTLWRTKHIGQLADAERKVIWTPPPTGPYSKDIWAPELHYLRGKWYVYVSADAGSNESHRVWVLESSSQDPFADAWTLKGKMSDATDRWAIDGSVFEVGNRLYFIWSGWEGADNGVQSIYIAGLSNPWTVNTPRVRISTPEYHWEKIGDLARKTRTEENPGIEKRQPLHVDVNEGPEALLRNRKVFLLYSAGGCWTDYYTLGMLTASDNADLLDPKSWTKSPIPVFWESPKASAYGTGHNGFFRSPDGKEDWIIYHANPKMNQGCGQERSPRAQPFTWNSDGTPNFGRPAQAGVPIPVPSGENISPGTH